MLDPQGTVVPDVAENLPGRGAWVGAERHLIAKAASSGAFKRAFKADARIDGELVDAVEARLKVRALSALGLLRRAGDVATGFDQVGGVLKDKKTRTAMLLTASDAAEDGASKLARLAKGLPVFRLFTAGETSAALGRDGVRHAAVKQRQETAKLANEIVRFAHFISRPTSEEVPS